MVFFKIKKKACIELANIWLQFYFHTNFFYYFYKQVLFNTYFQHFGLLFWFVWIKFIFDIFYQGYLLKHHSFWIQHVTLLLFNLHLVMFQRVCSMHIFFNPYITNFNVHKEIFWRFEGDIVMLLYVFRKKKKDLQVIWLSLQCFYKD